MYLSYLGPASCFLIFSGGIQQLLDRRHCSPFQTPSGLRNLHLEAQKSLMAKTSLFTDMAGNTPYKYSKYNVCCLFHVLCSFVCWCACIFGWHHQVNGHEFGQAPGVVKPDMLQSMGCKESDKTERLN